MVDDDLRISFESQINANLTGRINAKIRDITDKEMSNAITIGMMEGATKEEKSVYVKFINTLLKELYTELYAEFVGEGYISKDSFLQYFNKAKVNWIKE
jgi:cobalamin biosynthesis Co2+ chelatase CbiK